MAHLSEGMGEMKRTAMCAEFSTKDIGSVVTLMGWVQKRRDLGGVIFVDLRDRTGIMQVVFDAGRCEKDFTKAEKIRNEFVIAVTGEIVARDEETVNKNLATGEIEVHVTGLKILSASETPPFMVDEEKVSEVLRLKYRYIDLRRSELQRNILMRHDVARYVREFLDNNGFINIETPMLIKSTPEGARDYLVASRVHQGCFYALPQSPQIFKQILMLSGYDKYYQIVKCFRDEDLRADRQPEFTQIDIEMSFVNVEDVINANEALISDVFSKAMGRQIPTPFPRLTYEDAMNRYGCDKPDVRFDMEIKDISDIVADCDFKVFSQVVKNGGTVRAINAKGGAAELPRKEVDTLIEVVKPYKAKGLAWIQVAEDGLKSPIVKFMTEEQVADILKRLDAEVGDLLLFVADKESVVFPSLAHLRLHMGKRLGMIDEDELNFVWVTEFPVFEYDEIEKRYTAMHHPFTAPMDEDVELLESAPEKARAKAYDLVLNGVELGGGSIRIHDRGLQEKMFTALGFTKEQAEEQFGFLLEAFKYGTPPHGGIAYGLDRMLMLMTKSPSIRDVIAFPKVQNASDPMTEAPSRVSEKQLEELSLSIVEDEE